MNKLIKRNDKILSVACDMQIIQLSGSVIEMGKGWGQRQGQV